MSARGCVLIQLHGRSRSASVAIAWLMRRHCATFEQALAALRACHIPVDGSLIYAEQLQRWAADSRRADGGDRGM
jgi:protein-tyrosine phosphatase